MVVEDDSMFAAMLYTTLKKAGFQAQRCATLQTAQSKLAERSVDLACVDLNLPDGSGIDLISLLTKDAPRTKIVVITGSKSVDVSRFVYKSGALDVIHKPCDFQAVQAKLQAFQQFHYRFNEPRAEYQHRRMWLDYEQGLFHFYHQTIPLRSKEFKLMECFLNHRNVTLSKQQIIEYVWGTEQRPAESTIEVYILRLRKKLPDPNLIKTRRGFGYIFSDQAAVTSLT